MKSSQKGFTLVELVVVIVLLGILGVTALGKYQDLSTQAEAAVRDGVASEIAAASAINFANSKLNTATGSWTGAGVVVIDNGDDCDSTGGTNGTIADLFQTESLPAGFTSAGTAGVCTVGSAVTCTLTAQGTNVTVDIICTDTAP